MDEDEQGQVQTQEPPVDEPMDGEQYPWVDDTDTDDGELLGDEEPSTEPVDEPVADAEPQTPPVVVGPTPDFTEQELETLQEALDSGDARQIIVAQQAIARRTYQLEQRATSQAEQFLAEVGVTPEFKAEYGAELRQALDGAPSSIRGTREGASLLIGAVVAQRARQSKRPLAEEFARAAAALGHKTAPAPKPEQGLKPPAPDPRAAKAGGGARVGRMSVDDKLRKMFG